MSLAVIVIFFVVLLGAALVFERARKSTGLAPKDEAPQGLPKADELGPTQTGKYRVQQMLKNTADQWEEDATAAGEDDPLPDPFGTGKVKKQ